jgi:hypothetical protein
MAAGEWSFADLEPGQVELVHEAERTLDTDIVMAYTPSSWGTVDPDTIGDGLDPVELDSGQIEYLREIEQRVGGVLVAYRHDVA